MSWANAAVGSAASTPALNSLNFRNPIATPMQIRMLQRTIDRARALESSTVPADDEDSFALGESELAASWKNLPIALPDNSGFVLLHCSIEQADDLLRRTSDHQLQAPFGRQEALLFEMIAEAGESVPEAGDFEQGE